jgi:hypothetical protein
MGRVDSVDWIMIYFFYMSKIEPRIYEFDKFYQFMC